MKKMRLVDKRGTFQVPEMKSIGECILPAKLKLKEVDALIDRMALAITNNEFAVDLVEKTSRKNGWAGLIDPVMEYGPEEFPRFIAYSIILQNLTEAMFKDLRLFSGSLAFWLKIVDDKNLTKKMSIPLRIKYESIMYPAKKYNDFVLQGECPSDFAKFLLPLNIMEAVILDVSRGYFDNAYAGYVLAKHGTGGAPNPKTGAGATNVQDGAIITGQDLVESWDDLYQVWNAFFVATFGTTHLCKLLIPQVSEYHGGDRPGAYAYNRVIALIIHLFMMTFDHFDVDSDLTGKTESVFSNEIFSDQKAFFKIWGETNHASAALYSQDVQEANAWVQVKNKQSFKSRLPRTEQQI
ncbi:MAG: hypothetical protein ACU836_16965 [Gammaproteobacteria bacterium]